MTDYIVTAKPKQDINKVAEEIEALSTQKGSSVEIGNKYEIIGALMMSCKADFAAAVRKLSSVSAVEEEGIHYTTKKNGPRL